MKIWNMSLLSNSDSSYKSRVKNNKNMSWAKNWKVPIWFKRKKKNFGDFRVFGFALYPRSKTRKSRKFWLPRILTQVVTEDLKTPEKWIETNLEPNWKFRSFPSFRFCPIPKSKTRKSRKVLLYLIIYDFT